MDAEYEKRSVLAEWHWWDSLWPILVLQLVVAPRWKMTMKEHAFEPFLYWKVFQTPVSCSHVCQRQANIEIAWRQHALGGTVCGEPNHSGFDCGRGSREVFARYGSKEERTNQPGDRTIVFLLFLFCCPQTMSLSWRPWAILANDARLAMSLGRPLALLSCRPKAIIRQKCITNHSYTNKSNSDLQPLRNINFVSRFLRKMLAAGSELLPCSQQLAKSWTLKSQSFRALQIWRNWIKLSEERQK